MQDIPNLEDNSTLLTNFYLIQRKQTEISFLSPAGRKYFWHLKKLENCILRTILVWLLFFSIWIYASLLSWFMQICFSFCAFAVFCLFWIRRNLQELCNICVIIIYTVEVRCTVFLFWIIIFQLNDLWKQKHVLKTWLQLLIKKNAFRELSSFKNSIYKRKCGTFTKWESVKETLSANHFLRTFKK